MQAEFYPLLRQWLASPAGSESRNNIIRAANGTIITSQLGAVHSPPNDEVRFIATTSHVCLSQCCMHTAVRRDTP